MGALPFGCTAVMAVAAAAVYIGGTPAVRRYSSAEMQAGRAVVAVVYAVGAVWLSSIADVGRRRRWRLHNLLGIELRQVCVAAEC